MLPSQGKTLFLWPHAGIQRHHGRLQVPTPHRPHPAALAACAAASSAVRLWAAGGSTRLGSFSACGARGRTHATCAPLSSWKSCGQSCSGDTGCALHPPAHPRHTPGTPPAHPLQPRCTPSGWAGRLYSVATRTCLPPALQLESQLRDVAQDLMHQAKRSLSKGASSKHASRKLGFGSAVTDTIV
jgi:hypothetical protein